MRSIFAAALASALVAAIAVPSYAKDKTPQMTPLQIQSMQTHEFDAPKEDVFASVVSVMQDAGYRIENAEIQTGIITSVGSTKAKLNYNIFFGFGKSKKTPMATAFVEQIGKTTRVRLNFVMAKVKSTIYGSQPQDEEPVLDQSVYSDAFEKIEQALFVRRSMLESAPPKQTVSPAAPPSDTPAASSTSSPH
jgi:hypothetical protein